MSDYVYHTEELEGFTLEIVSDPDPINPREDYEQITKMVCFSRRYKLGDEHPFEDPTEFFVSLFDEYATLEERQAYFKSRMKGQPLLEWKGAIKRLGKELHGVGDWFRYEGGHPPAPAAVFLIPVYAYIHSGITISAGSFSCPWDSGCIGFIYITRKDAEFNLGVKEGQTLEQRALEFLKADIETYDMYLTGDIWGIVVKDPEGEVVESCWGFYGTDDAKSEGQSELKWAVAAAKKKVQDDIHSADPKTFGRL